LSYNLDDIIIEYFEDCRIVHITAKSKICSENQEDCFIIARYIGGLVEEKLAGNKGFMIVDYNQIVVQLESITDYAEEVYAFLEKNLFHGGYARYGYSLGRVSAKLISNHMSDEPPLLFHSKKEAFDYINAQIEKNSLENDGLIESEIFNQS